MVNPTVFVCYRREDSAPYAGRLFDRIVAELGPAQVFMDIDHVDYGDNFPDVLGRALQHVTVVLVLIGRSWVSATNENGSRRLDQEDDFVRMEIETAISRGVRIIPVLVAGAGLPSRDQLPSSLHPLLLRQAAELTDRHFAEDVKRLTRSLKRRLDDSRGAPAKHCQESGQEPNNGGAVSEFALDDPEVRRNQISRRVIAAVWLASATIASVLAAVVVLGLSGRWPDQEVFEGSVVLRDGFKFFNESAFRFSSKETVAWDDKGDIGVAKPPDASAPMFFVPYDVDYQHPEWDKGAAAAILKVSADELTDVSACPADGYAHHYFSVEPGAVYCLRARDGRHYAVIKVTKISDDRIGFDYKYQPREGRQF